MGGGSGKSSSNKQAKPAAPSVATNPNFIPMQQPQPFAPGMQQALAQQLTNGYGSPGLLGSQAQDFNGLLNNIYSPQAIAADPIGVASQIAAANQQQAAQQPDKLKNTPQPQNNVKYLNGGGSGRSR